MDVVTDQLMQHDRPALRGVSETLLIPLAARALMARRDPENFVDPLSSEFLRILGEDASRLERDRWNMAGGCARTIILDRELKAALSTGQKTLVLNLGAGLCSRYWRFGMPAGVRWIDVDLPQVVELKRQLLAEYRSEPGLLSGQWTSIPADVTSDAWMNEVAPAEGEKTIIIAEGLLMYLPEADVRRLVDRLVARFPGGTMYLETWSPFVSRVWGHLSRRIRESRAPVQWGLRRPTTLAEWNRKIQVKDSWSPGDINPREWGILRFAPRLRRSLMKIVELQFAK